MMEEFKKLLFKKQKEQASKPVDKDKLKAKAEMMKQLSDLLGKDMAEDVKGMKKVTVASDSSEGLKEGLKKAKEIMDKKPDLEDEMKDMEDESAENEMEESSEKEKSEHESGEEKEDEKDNPGIEGLKMPHTVDEEPSDKIKQQIKELEDKIAKLRAKKVE